LPRLLVLSLVLAVTPVGAHAQGTQEPSVKPEGSPQQAPGPLRVKGTLLARGTRAPLAGAHVTAMLDRPEDPRRFETDAALEGSFELHGLPDGHYRVIVTGSGIERSSFDETLGKGQVLTVRYFVARSWAARHESTVRGAVAREEVSRQTLTTEELVKMPG